MRNVAGGMLNDQCLMINYWLGADGYVGATPEVYFISESDAVLFFARFQRFTLHEIRFTLC